MSNQPLVLTLALVLTMVSPTVLAQDELPKVLAVAKMAGACGILDQMVHFQGTTKLDGGNLFVTRFWATEAARLGMSTTELSETCDQAIRTYEQLVKP